VWFRCGGWHCGNATAQPVVTSDGDMLRSVRGDEPGGGARSGRSTCRYVHWGGNTCKTTTTLNFDGSQGALNGKAFLPSIQSREVCGVRGRYSRIRRRYQAGRGECADSSESGCGRYLCATLAWVRRIATETTRISMCRGDAPRTERNRGAGDSRMAKRCVGDGRPRRCYADGAVDEGVVLAGSKEQ